MSEAGIAIRKMRTKWSFVELDDARADCSLWAHNASRRRAQIICSESAPTAG